MKLWRVKGSWCAVLAGIVGAAGVVGVVGVGACDQDYAMADRDASDGNETIGFAGGALGDPYGADPASGAYVPGRADYSPDDPDMDPSVVRLGVRAAAEAAALRGHVIASLKAWEGGPVVALAGSDAEAKALGVVPAEPVVDRAAETGSWMVVAGRPVIAEGPSVASAWAAREPSDDKRGPAAGNAFIARLPLALARVPDAVRGVIGAEVRVFDQAREVCIARVGGLELEARLVHEPLGPWDPAYSEREILERGLRSVVATLEPIAGDAASCAKGVVAVGVRAFSPALFAEIETTPSMFRRAVAAACALPSWQGRVGSRFEDDVSLGGCESLRHGTTVQTFETRTGRRFVVLANGDMKFGFRVNEHGLDNAWVHVGDGEPAGVIDVRADGTPELVLGSTERAPAAIVGARFAGDLSEPTFLDDWTPVPPERTAVGGFAVPDYSVFKAR